MGLWYVMSVTKVCVICFSWGFSLNKYALKSALLILILRKL